MVLILLEDTYLQADSTAVKCYSYLEIKNPAIISEIYTAKDTSFGALKR